VNALCCIGVMICMCCCDVGGGGLKIGGSVVTSCQVALERLLNEWVCGPSISYSCCAHS